MKIIKTNELIGKKTLKRLQLNAGQKKTSETSASGKILKPQFSLSQRREARVKAEENWATRMSIYQSLGMPFPQVLSCTDINNNSFLWSNETSAVVAEEPKRASKTYVPNSISAGYHKLKASGIEIFVLGGDLIGESAIPHLSTYAARAYLKNRSSSTSIPETVKIMLDELYGHAFTGLFDLDSTSFSIIEIDRKNKKAALVNIGDIFTVAVNFSDDKYGVFGYDESGINSIEGWPEFNKDPNLIQESTDYSARKKIDTSPYRMDMLPFFVKTIKLNSLSRQTESGMIASRISMVFHSYSYQYGTRGVLDAVFSNGSDIDIAQKIASLGHDSPGFMNVNESAAYVVSLPFGLDLAQTTKEWFVYNARKDKYVRQAKFRFS